MPVNQQGNTNITDQAMSSVVQSGGKSLGSAIGDFLGKALVMGRSGMRQEALMKEESAQRQAVSDRSNAQSELLQQYGVKAASGRQISPEERQQFLQVGGNSAVIDAYNDHANQVTNTLKNFDSAIQQGAFGDPKDPATQQMVGVMRMAMMSGDPNMQKVAMAAIESHMRLSAQMQHDLFKANVQLGLHGEEVKQDVGAAYQKGYLGQAGRTAAYNANEPIRVQQKRAEGAAAAVGKAEGEAEAAPITEPIKLKKQAAEQTQKQAIARQQLEQTNYQKAQSGVNAAVQGARGGTFGKKIGAKPPKPAALIAEVDRANGDLFRSPNFNYDNTPYQAGFRMIGKGNKVVAGQGIEDFMSNLETSGTIDPMQGEQIKNDIMQAWESGNSEAFNRALGQLPADAQMAILETFRGASEGTAKRGK